MERLTEGTLLDGRYRVQRRLGSGGMADVFCAEDLQLGRKVALKLLHPRFAEDEEFVERFRREASSAAGLQHQHVVSVYDRGEVDGTSYIAMEYVDGRTLKALVQEEGPLPPARAIDLTIQVLRAVRFAHKRGIIHRDLKPHNVMVDGEDRAKVTDFGIAKAGASDMTQTGSIMGTAQYVAPEQAQGLPVSAASDLYSVGIMLFELLTARLPFDGDSAVAIALKQVGERPPVPSQVAAGIPPELDAIVLRALEKQPAARFADADAFIAALEDAGRRLAGGGASAEATSVAMPATALGGSAGAPAAGPPTGAHVVPAPTGTWEALGGQYPPAPPPEVDPDARERSGWWIALLVGLVVAALAAGALLLLGGSDPTRVPNVVGAPEADAQRTLRTAGFETDSVTTRSEEDAGTVIEQDPPADAEAEEGALVTLTVSSGPGQETVPQLRDVGRRTAARRLTELGFAVAMEERPDADIRRDRVVETTPPAGERLDRGEEVTLVVSTGPRRIAVPEVVGRDEEEARTALEEAGFQVRSREVERTDADAGEVTAQDPAGGGRAAEGSTVTITVARAPAVEDVPDVTGSTLEEALAELQDAGFDVEPEEVDVTAPEEEGVVQSQDPAGGEEARRGSTVTITIGRVPPAADPPAAPDTGTDGGTAPAPDAEPDPAVPDAGGEPAP
jgi:serine/threonine-protein kinase